MSDIDIQEICEISSRKNSKVDITGILLYSDGSFFQILEGPKKNIEALMCRISIDLRHKGIIELQNKPIQSRAFSGFDMQGANISRSVSITEYQEKMSRIVKMIANQDDATLETFIKNFMMMSRS